MTNTRGIHSLPNINPSFLFMFLSYFQFPIPRLNSGRKGKQTKKGKSLRLL